MCLVRAAEGVGYRVDDVAVVEVIAGGKAVAVYEPKEVPTFCAPGSSEVLEKERS